MAKKKIGEQSELCEGVRRKRLTAVSVHQAASQQPIKLTFHGILVFCIFLFIDQTANLLDDAEDEDLLFN